MQILSALLCKSKDGDVAFEIGRWEEVKSTLKHSSS